MSQEQAVMEAPEKLVAALEAEVATLRKQVETLTAERDSLSNQLYEAKEAVEDHETAISNAVRNFMAECERPVGTLRFKVPDTPAAQRALLALNDSIERKL